MEGQKPDISFFGEDMYGRPKVYKAWFDFGEHMHTGGKYLVLHIQRRTKDIKKTENYSFKIVELKMAKEFNRGLLRAIWQWRVYLRNLGGVKDEI